MKKRIFAALLCVIMLFGMLPVTALAADPVYVAWIGETGYETLGEAVKAAKSGDTIQLGEGVYSLYEVCGHDKGSLSHPEYTVGKDLTFVGADAEDPSKTIWQIGADTPKGNNGEFDSDYSFKGSEKVTFKDMTLRTGNEDTATTKSYDYLGFSHSNITVTENCIIKGWTAYWGYQSASFIDTTFICTPGAYALWDYSSHEMSFIRCYFESVSGRTVHVYREAAWDGTEEDPLVVNFEDCEVVAGGLFGKKSVLNIKDNNNYYLINISGDNKVTGLTPNSITCSRLFQVEGYSDGYNLMPNEKGRGTPHATVTMDGTTVWQNGKMEAHAIDTEHSKYTDGYLDNAFRVTATEWEAQDGYYTRHATRVCKYCGYTTEGEELGYRIRYDLNGGEGAEGADYTDETAAEGTTITLKPAPSKDGYVFAGWSDGDTTYNAGDAVTVEHAMTFTAQWKLEGEEIIAGMTGLLTVAGLGTDDHIAYVYGYPDGTVRPNGTITRAEVTTIFYRLLTSARRDEIFTSENSFRDVNSSMWYNKAASSMAAGGYIQGYADGTFGANKPITRAEFVCLAARFATKTTGFASYTDVDNGHWAARSIAICASNGWVQGYEDGTFRPDQPITRAEAMTIINRMLGRGVSKGYVCKGAARFTDNDPGSWYYYEILEATNDHEYRNARPFEQWIRATLLRSYDMDKYERP